MRSLSRSFLLGVGATTVVTTVLATAAGFFVFRADLTRREAEHLREYMDQRAVVVSNRFSNLSQIHAQASAQLTKVMDEMSDVQARAVVDHRLPLQPDGTRRSRPEDFEGSLDATGARTAGMGAFVSHGRDLSPEQTRTLAGAFHVVNAFGVGVHNRYDNFYFATPEDRVVMYAPDRADRLSFYRHDAPADLSFHDEEMMRMVAPGADPGGRTRCTALQRLIQDKAGRRLATACMTPFWYKGRYAGAFGSSIQLQSYLQAPVIQAALPHTTSLLLRPEGDVIAVTDHSTQVAPSPEALARLEHRFQLSRLVSELNRHGRTSGLTRSPDGRHLIAYARISEPDWWLVMAYPKAELDASALRSASWILLLGLLAAAVQTALIVALAHRTVTLPLKRLALSCDSEAPTADLEAREDEIGVLGRALRDERAKTQAVLTSLEERVAERTAELERASTEKDRFLANMSHELRTPLNGVIAVSETLAGLQRTRRGREMADLIVSSSRLLEHVLSDILDFQRLETGKVQLKAEPFDLATVLSHVAQLHRAVAETKGLKLTLELSPEATGRYHGDAVRLTQVVSNLLSNAVKFTEAGEVGLKASGGPGRLVLTVTDSGVGFDAATRSRLFHRFEQADPSVRRRYGGTGLGLAICRSLVDAMGGSIRAASAPGFGSVFTVELPLPRAAEAAPPEPVEAPAAAPALAGVRVLLAEDHPTNRKVVELILESAGVELVTVENGREALDALSTASFDLVLMDVQMPEMDGLSATRLWRERERLLHLPPTPVVMLTANAMPEHREEGRRAGADRHLAKPIRAADLLLAVDELTRAPGGRRAA